VVNTPRERAALYFRSHPTRVLLLADPDARTHRLFGLPSVVPDEAFAAVRSNPTGELPDPMHPMEANAVLNAKDGFALTAVDEEVFAAHGTQLAGHTVAMFPSPAEILAAARDLPA
jgi:hypothetical protein